MPDLDPELQRRIAAAMLAAAEAFARECRQWLAELDQDQDHDGDRQPESGNGRRPRNRSTRHPSKPPTATPGPPRPGVPHEALEALKAATDARRVR